MTLNITLKPGKYIAAISGGIDSIVLLNLLSKLETIDVIVAHVNHGIREDSAADEVFVRQLAGQYGFDYVSIQLELGKCASEELAREQRYKFLYQQKSLYGASAIITAHHKDDVLETALINLVRGTGRRGLVSLRSNEDIARPLLGYYKAELVDYALRKGLEWVEDSTNYQHDYLRNRVRFRIERADTSVKIELFKIIVNMYKINDAIDLLLEAIYTDVIIRKVFVLYEHAVAKEIVAFWLRKKSISFDRSMVDLLTVRIKTARPGTKFIAKNGKVIHIEKDVIFTD